MPRYQLLMKAATLPKHRLKAFRHQIQMDYTVVTIQATAQVLSGISPSDMVVPILAKEMRLMVLLWVAWVLVRPFKMWKLLPIRMMVLSCSAVRLT
ncbi:hypothetical protein DDZ15_06055 [Rhodohalobacter mucosus]|uniref:Uncharacterized protein n=1 Tax=Rhodohalobacter mucosus TaxID=2079485 RepID=A0A316TUT3_9BACT|nr:hypothetical protein DDZ15_06055 [Rhodohalobacter mucosus]